MALITSFDRLYMIYMNSVIQSMIAIMVSINYKNFILNILFKDVKYKKLKFNQEKVYMKLILLKFFLNFNFELQNLSIIA